MIIYRSSDTAKERGELEEKLSANSPSFCAGIAIAGVENPLTIATNAYAITLL